MEFFGPASSERLPCESVAIRVRTSTYDSVRHASHVSCWQRNEQLREGSFLRHVESRLLHCPGDHRPIEGASSLMFAPFHRADIIPSLEPGPTLPRSPG